MIIGTKRLDEDNKNHHAMRNGGVRGECLK